MNRFLQITDEDGDLVELSTYTPFGELSYEIRDTNDASRFQYTGQGLDRESELYDYGARSSDLVQQWQAGSELWLRFTEFGIILAVNTWRPKTPKGTLKRAFK